MSILTRIVNEEIPPVHDVRPDVSPVLDAIARKATRRNRDERYATAEEMRARLEEYLRERKDGVSERDLARMMSDLFADIRDDVALRDGDRSPRALGRRVAGSVCVLGRVPAGASEGSAPCSRAPVRSFPGLVPLARAECRVYGPGAPQHPDARRQRVAMNLR